MPVFNGGSRLRDTVESIISQSFTDFEFLIINDGSTDNTAEILQSISDPRIRIIHKENEGLGKTLNLGLEIALGEYIARIDADDLATFDRLEKQVKFLNKHPNVAVMGSCMKIIYSDGTERIRRKPVSPESVRRHIIKSNPIAHPVAMFRKKIIQRLGAYDVTFDGSLGRRYGMDYNLWVRVMAAGFDLANHPDCLIIHRKHNKSISGNKRLRFMLMERARIRMWAKEKLQLGVKANFEISAVLILTLLQHLFSFRLDSTYNRLSSF